jgi:hypothetical protein
LATSRPISTSKPTSVGALGADLQHAGGLDLIEVRSCMRRRKGGNLQKGGSEKRRKEFHRLVSILLFSGPSIRMAARFAQNRSHLSA